MRRIESFIIKNKLPEMIDKLNDQQITSLVGEIISEDSRMLDSKSENAVGCSENI
jgi:hypothetical protein